MPDVEFKGRYSKQIQAFTKYSKNYNKKKKYNTKDVILFRLDLIGDCTMFSSAAKALREFYKDRKMTVVCLKISKPIFERIGGFDRIITVDFKPHDIDYDKLDLVIKEIQEYEFDILLQPQISRMPLADILCVATKCNKRIAIQTLEGNSPKNWIDYFSWIYDEIIPYPEGHKSEFDYYATFVRGIVGKQYRITKPELKFNSQNIVNDKYFVLYVGASMEQKLWPLYRFSKVAEHIFDRTNLNAVILGVNSEKKYADLVIANVKSIYESRIIDLCGQTTIDDVIDIIGNAEFVVSNDTSGVHIACATNTPSVAINGGWHYGRFLPYSIEEHSKSDKIPLVAEKKMDCYYCGWNLEKIEKVNKTCLVRVKSGESSDCIQKVRTEQVIELVDKILAEEGY